MNYLITKIVCKLYIKKTSRFFLVTCETFRQHSGWGSAMRSRTAWEVPLPWWMARWRQIKKDKQLRGTAKGKFIRKIEKFFWHVKIKVLEDKYNLIVKSFEEVAFANENYCYLFDETWYLGYKFCRTLYQRARW